MRDYARQARVALKVYLERGRKVLELISVGDFEGAEKMLQRRNAAFHNFRVAAVLADEQGFKVERDSEIRQTWPEVEQINQLLSVDLEKARENAKKQLVTCKRIRDLLEKYHSGKIKASEFTKSA